MVCDVCDGLKKNFKKTLSRLLLFFKHQTPFNLENRGFEKFGVDKILANLRFDVFLRD